MLTTTHREREESLREGNLFFIRAHFILMIPPIFLAPTHILFKISDFSFSSLSFLHLFLHLFVRLCV
jgi:hypothetical protein